MSSLLLIWSAVVGLVVAGLAGMLVPILPGGLLLFCGLALAAWAEEFEHVGGGTVAVLALMAVATHAVDFLAGSLGARGFGASRAAMIGAAIGAVVGIFFGIPGILLGPFVGAVVGELLAERGLGAAGRAGVGASLGALVAIALKVALGVAMVALFLGARFFW